MTSASLTDDLTRVFAMSASWDEAADAMMRRDDAAFDAAMKRFHDLNREAGVNALVGNHAAR